MERGGAFRILIVGDFSGGGQASVPVAERRIQQVDRDDFEEVFHRLAVTTALDVVEGSVERVEISSDEGRTWQRANLAKADPLHPYAWRRFEQILLHGKAREFDFDPG